MEIKTKILNRISNIKNHINIKKFEIFNKYKKSLGVTKDKRENPLIVSLTTYPKRFNVVYLTIESLMNQTMKPDKIILWLAKDELVNNEIPSKISKLKLRGLEIRIIDENLKSYNKLIYALKEFKTSNIITCDDDIIYPKFFIEGLYKTLNKFPKNIIAYRCTLMKKIDEKTLAPYLSWPAATDNKPSFNLFPTGVGGILYPPNSLNEQVFNKDLFLRLAPSADDIWFKAMALLNNTKTVMVNEKSIEFPMIRGSQDDALWHVNVLENKNDEQLKNVFDYFKLYDYIK